MGESDMRTSKVHFPLYIVLRSLVLCYVIFLVQSAAESSAGSSARFSPYPSFVTKQDACTSPTKGIICNNGNVTGNRSQCTPSEAIPEWKQQLPFPLNNKTKTLQRITVPGPFQRSVEIYLLGTAHVSNDSSRDVRLLLEAVDPDVIFLELCDQRIPMLIVDPEPKHNQTVENTMTTTGVGKKMSFWQRLGRRKSRNDRSGSTSSSPKSMFDVATSLLTSMQQDHAASLGVELGGEFRVAYQYWNSSCQTSYNSNRRVHLILGDRPLYLTFIRAWESLRLWGKTKLLVGLVISSFQKSNPEELLEWMQSILNDDSADLLSKSIAELATHFPTLEEVIIRERDVYMACKLFQTCRYILLADTIANQKYRLVAIVGAGHVRGIQQWLTERSNENTTESPEEILSRLVQLKNHPLTIEDLNYLVNDIMEVNPDQLREIFSGQVT